MGVTFFLQNQQQAQIRLEIKESVPQSASVILSVFLVKILS